MNRQKIKQGDFGYISHKKKTEILKTIVFFAIPLSLYIAGYATTKSRLNVLTIVAILGMLPASKQLVSMIMYLKAHGISEADHEAIKEAVVPLCNSYDNIFTTYEKTYEVPSVVCGKALQRSEKAGIPHYGMCQKRRLSDQHKDFRQAGKLSKQTVYHQGTGRYYTGKGSGCQGNYPRDHFIREKICKTGRKTAYERICCFRKRSGAEMCQIYLSYPAQCRHLFCL